MKNVLITTPTFSKFSEEPIEILRKANLNIINISDQEVTENLILKHLDNTVAILVGLEQITPTIINAAKSLKVIGKHGVGIDNIHKKTAEERGVTIVNAPGSNSEAVADFAFGLLLNVARRINFGSSEGANGRWPRIAGYPVYGKTIGIIGFGAIGKGVALRARGFQMRVIAYDIQWDEDFIAKNDIVKGTLEDIYRESDFISLHVALTEDTKNLINEDSINKMKKNAIIINTARGGILDEMAVKKALVEQRIAGLGIDAFSVEPPVDISLFHMDNVVATPHLAGYTFEALTNMSSIVANNIVKAL